MGEFSCSGRVSSFCSTNDTLRVNLVTIPMISYEWGKDREVLTTSGLFRGQPSHGCQLKTCDDFNIAKRKPWFSGFLVSSNPQIRFNPYGMGTYSNTVCHGLDTWTHPHFHTKGKQTEEEWEWHTMYGNISRYSSWANQILQLNNYSPPLNKHSS